MNKKAFNTEKLVRPKAPFSQAIVAGQFLFLSGQGPLDVSTGKPVKGDVKAQSRKTLQNMKILLEEAGSSMNHVLKVTIFLVDMNDYASVNEVYAEFFKGEPPARTCVQVSRLPGDILVEMDAIALLPTN